MINDRNDIAFVTAKNIPEDEQNEKNIFLKDCFECDREFFKEYWTKMGDPSKVAELEKWTFDKWLEKNSNRLNTHILVLYKQEVAGWIQVDHNESVLHNVWIKPEYRGLGLASAIYEIAINCGFTLLSLAWDNIKTLKQIQFWNDRGYKSIKIEFGQTGKSKTGLCKLVADNIYTKDATYQPLTLAGIKKAKDLSDKVIKKFASSLVRGNFRTHEEVLTNLVSGRQVVLDKAMA